MKRFILAGRMIFEAKDIDDAFRKLSEHFDDLYDEKEGIELLVGTNIEIKVITEPFYLKIVD